MLLIEIYGGKDTDTYIKAELEKMEVPQRGSSHTVIKNDNLWKIAQKELGNSATNAEISEYVLSIAKLNGLDTSQKMDNIKVNTIIYLPKRDNEPQKLDIKEEEIINYTEKKQNKDSDKAVQEANGNEAKLANVTSPQTTESPAAMGADSDSKGAKKFSLSSLWNWKENEKPAWEPLSTAPVENVNNIKEKEESIKEQSTKEQYNVTKAQQCFNQKAEEFINAAPKNVFVTINYKNGVEARVQIKEKGSSHKKLYFYFDLVPEKQAGEYKIKNISFEDAPSVVPLQIDYSLDNKGNIIKGSGSSAEKQGEVDPELLSQLKESFAKYIQNKKSDIIIKN